MAATMHDTNIQHHGTCNRSCENYHCYVTNTIFMISKI